MTIIIETVPHAKQRYATTGDWYYDDVEQKTLRIVVSEMGDWRYEALVGFHELCEALICRFANIAQEEVDAFDKAYEENRSEGNESEPGDDPKAPYFWAHQVATRCERLLSFALSVDWHKYEEANLALYR